MGVHKRSNQDEQRQLAMRHANEAPNVAQMYQTFFNTSGRVFSI